MKILDTNNLSFFFVIIW